MRNLGLFSAAVVLSGLGSTALAADLIIEQPAPVMMDYATPSGWEGAYVGVHGGYAWGDSDHIGSTVGDMEMMGGFLGAQIGYNFVLTEGFIVGLQGDINIADITGTYDAGFPEITDTINATGSATVHLGFDGGVFMPYVLGGVAAANSERVSEIGPSETQLHVGYTVGAGVAVKVSDPISAFVEARYSDYGTAIYEDLPSDPEVGLTDMSIRVGLNFHF